MKSIITTTALLIAATATMTAQTIATNWTATDCNSVSHTLFTELDNGKVIVFAWVMPCGSCVNPSTTAYNVVQSYASSNPGKVLFYLADDIGDANCTTLSNWITANNIGNTANVTVFSNTGNIINENDFGGSGMPHIVVMGGTNHQIYFNKKNSAADDATGIQNAIDAAIGATGINDAASQLSFSLTPNPAAGLVSIKYSEELTKVSITSLTGQLIREYVYSTPKNNPVLDITDITAGVYLIKVTDKDGRMGIQKFLKQ